MKKWNLESYSEISVTSIDEIYQLVEEYNKFWNVPRSEGNTEQRTFYRGQSNVGWKIEPSILRQGAEKERTVFIKNREKLLGQQLFDQFSYLQHYIIGTRLIDFTTDIDVALYFACNGNSEVDAAVFLYVYNAHQANWIDTAIFEELMTMDDSGVMSVNDFSTYLYQKYEKFRNRFRDIPDLNLFLMGFLDHGYMVYPNEDSKKNNIRVARQKGAFFITGLEFTEYISDVMRFESQAGKNIFKCHSIKIPDSLVNRAPLVKIIIDKGLKTEIIKFLEKEKGITRKYLFPDE